MIDPNTKVTPIKSVHRSSIENRINGCHFNKSPLLAVFRHRFHNLHISLKAMPNPVQSKEVLADWLPGTNLPVTFDVYQLVKIVLPYGGKTYDIQPDAYEIVGNAIRFTLPERSLETSARKQRRYQCVEELSVVISQKSLAYRGHSLNFSPRGMFVNLEESPQIKLERLEEDKPATLTVTKNEHIYFTGDVFVQKRKEGQYFLHLSGDNEQRPHAAPVKRASRLVLNPAPCLVFKHPFTNRCHSLKVNNISALGMSVEENGSTGVLLPGLLIHDAQLYIGTTPIMTCLLQVMYSNQRENEKYKIDSGLMLLDVSNNQHFSYMGVIEQVKDPHSYIGSQVDLEELFAFFFESGFIYPSKYHEIIEQIEKVKSVYQSLYEKGNGIERHFIYKADGIIQGHISALRLYRKSWINQHHAALNNYSAGLKVLRAISEYQNESYPLHSTNIKYILAYYRPDNKFPRRFFGRFAQQINNIQTVSEDKLGYFYNVESFQGDEGFPEGWLLEKAESLDLQEFESFYAEKSGGLLTKGLDLTSDLYDDDQIENLYKECGLKRRREVYSLRENGRLKMIVDVQNSDIGLNLSEITNAISCYFLSMEPFPPTVLRSVIFKLANHYQKWNHPVTVFPNDSTILGDIVPDKTYTLWTLDITRGGGDFVDMVHKYCRFDTDS